MWNLFHIFEAVNSVQQGSIFYVVGFIIRMKPAGGEEIAHSFVLYLSGTFGCLEFVHKGKQAKIKSQTIPK